MPAIQYRMDWTHQDPRVKDHGYEEEFDVGNLTDDEINHCIDRGLLGYAGPSAQVLKRCGFTVRITWRRMDHKGANHDGQNDR